jgi:hypothetical protein
MFKHSEQAITHIRVSHGDSNQWSTLQGYKPDNMTHTGQVGTTSGNNSRHDQGDDQGSPQPSACLPHVCLRRQTVGGPCTITMYTRCRP